MKKFASCLVIYVLLVGPVVEVQAGPICQTRTSYNTNTYSYGHQNYGTNYYNPTNYDYVPVVKKVAVVDQFFYSSRDYLRDEAILEAIKALREAKSSVLNQNMGGTPVKPDAPAVSPEVDSFLRGLPLPDDGSTGSTKVGSGSNPMQELVRANCLNCHNSGKKLGHMDLSDLSKLSFDDTIAVHTAVVGGTMPPKGKLPDVQVAVVKRWFRETIKK